MLLPFINACIPFLQKNIKQSLANNVKCLQQYFYLHFTYKITISKSNKWKKDSGGYQKNYSKI